ncbi:hypothetical protein BGZ94_009431 [Podila epigama]|nr:hypothetical protein BGZ94_009431 [Podila epigama]
MLHELLITLSGYPGDIFRPYPPEPMQATTFAVHDFPLLHPAEKEGLDRLAQLGFYFKEFNEFIATYKTPTPFTVSSSSSSSSSLSATPLPSRQPYQSLYLKAMTNTLQVKLESYRDTIIQTEAGILSGQDNLGGMVPLSTISARFAPFQLVFPAIASLITEIRAGYCVSPESEERMPYSGGKLIDLLQDKAASGVPIQKEWMTDLLQGCQAVMMRQIVSWVIYGQIQDPFDEFFIYALQPTIEGGGNHGDSLGLFQSRLRGSTSLRHRMSSSSQQQQQQQSGSLRPQKIGHEKWQAEYAIDDRMLPTMIPASLAQAMLFIGKSIATSKQAKPKPIAIPPALTQKHLNLMLPFIVQPSPSTTASTQTDMTTLSGALMLNKLTHAIHQIRTDIANHLWVVVQVGDRVVSAIESFRRYFLLGDGEFALKLIDGLEDFKRNRLSRLGQNINSAGAVSIRDHDLGGMLTKAARGTRSIAREEDPSLYSYDLRLQSSLESSGGEASGQGGMFDDQLLGIPVRLCYTLSWPLDFFLTSEDLSQYGDMFAFLITVRKAQVKLQQAWIHVKAMSQGLCARKKRAIKMHGLLLFKRQAPMQQQQHQSSAAGAVEDTTTDKTDLDLQESEMIKHVGAIRADMAFVVDCLWAYLQADVIGPTYDSLLQTITTHKSDSSTKGSLGVSGTTTASSQTFDSIHNSHAEALYEIRRACLLTSQNLSQLLKNIIMSTEAFCGIISRRATTTGGGGGQEGGFRAGLGDDQDEKMWEDWTDIMHLSKTFREDTDQLFTDLSTVSKSGGLGDGPLLKRSTSGLGSSLLGNRPQTFEMARQVDQLLLRLEFSKSMRFNGVTDEQD